MTDDRFPAPAQNPNLLWARLFVDELAHCGVQDVCIAPGSRSTPLVFAFFAHEAFRIHRHLDERSAGFFGLGLALRQDRPVALLCTSGTAGANFFPAIIEAKMSQVPLLVLTADRPYELRDSGANQTIDQVNMFGDHVLWAVDVALPEKDPPLTAIRNLRTLAARAASVANGFRKGPVHLNFPFRKPLEPEQAGDWNASDTTELSTSRRDVLSHTTMERGVIRPSPDQIDWLATAIAQNREGLIICGPRCPGEEFPHAVAQLAISSGYPILADPLSGVRYGPHLAQAPICGAYETFLRPPQPLPGPRLVLRFGAVPTSKRLNDYLEQSEAIHHVQVREDGIWSDDSHRTNHFLQVNAASLCRSVSRQVDPLSATTWLDNWMDVEERCWTNLDRELADGEFDGAYVKDIVDQLSDGTILFAGNSLPVRHVDQFARPGLQSLQVYSNRGASGIDGNISTGLGLAAAGDRPVTILVGDITFYHDSNGLLALRDLTTKDITIVVLNNNGGGIFQRLPVAGYEPPFTRLFKAAHGLDLSSIAKTYELDYVKVRNRSEVSSGLNRRKNPRKARLVEIETDAEQDTITRFELESHVNAKLYTG